MALKPVPLPVRMIAAYLRSPPFEKGKFRVAAVAHKLLPDAAGTLFRTSTRHGFDMLVDPAQFIDRHLLLWGEWEPRITDLIRACLSPGGSFLDIGANIGYFSLLARTLVGDSGAVMAVEATPSTAQRLQQNMDINEMKLDLFRLAVGDREAQVTMRVDQTENIGRNHVTWASEGGAADTVPMVTLDRLLGDRQVDLIKIDIEGAEFLALRGARGLLQRSRPVIISEFTPEFTAKRFGGAPLALLDELDAAAYDTFVITPQGLQRWSREAIGRSDQLDLLSMPRGRPAPAALRLPA